MKIKADFSDLWDSVKRMGSHNVEFDITAEHSDDLELDAELSSTAGRDVVLDDLNTDNGVLSVEGRQVLLFIPDHGRNIDEVLAGREEGRKFHVADCRTLESMREQKRFDRYKATYNIGGKFQIYGVSYADGIKREGEIELHVCKNCLSYLNYQGYCGAIGAAKMEIYKQFSIAEFLSTYSTLFKNMPAQHQLADLGGYSDNWKEISDRYRASVNFRCESCKVDLNAHPGFLHTHHINGNKHENHTANLMALCLDCHRKQPKHGYMRVTHDSMVTINQLRKEQGQLEASAGWDQVIRLADKALDGLLRNYASKGMLPPEVGYEILGADDEIVAELELAWPTSKRGIAISEIDLKAANELGWHVLTLGDALRSMNG
ncbi:MAG: HNH endonuclease [Gammaproteobacteria bacterium]|nr:HNH endonuclease [Gammaproteobacteria bacterium]